MTMKKLLALLLVFVMVLSFAACSNAKPNDGDGKDDGNVISDDDWNDDDWGDDDWAFAEHDALPEGIKANEVDLSKYPADFNDWTAKNVMDYFEEAVDFPKDCEDWVQDHSYWTEFPQVYEVSGIWNEIGDITVMFFTFNTDAPDANAEKVEALKQAIINDPNHDYTDSKEGVFLGIQDHMIGNVCFSYGAYTFDDDLYYHIEAAYNQLVESMGLNPVF